MYIKFSHLISGVHYDDGSSDHEDVKFCKWMVKEKVCFVWCGYFMSKGFITGNFVVIKSNFGQLQPRYCEYCLALSSNASKISVDMQRKVTKRIKNLLKLFHKVHHFVVNRPLQTPWYVHVTEQKHFNVHLLILVLPFV